MSRFIRVLATACAATARIQDRDVICGGRDIHRAGALGITLSRAAFWVLHFPTSGVIAPVGIAPILFSLYDADCYRRSVIFVPDACIRQVTSGEYGDVAP